MGRDVTPQDPMCWAISQNGQPVQHYRAIQGIVGAYERLATELDVQEMVIPAFPQTWRKWREAGAGAIHASRAFMLSSSSWREELPKAPPAAREILTLILEKLNDLTASSLNQHLACHLMVRMRCLAQPSSMTMSFKRE